MKKIEISDEMYNSLMELSKDLNSQNHRITTMPYFFQIQTDEQVAVPEGNGTEAWHYDGAVIETDEEIKDAVIEYKEWEDYKAEFDKLTDSEIEEYLEEAGWSKCNFDTVKRLENSFFTEKACKAHIEQNSYHYNNPVDYLSHATRNPEMELVMKFLCELSGGKLHK